MENDENQENQSEELELQTKNLASALHEDWRKTHLKEDGSYKPRVELTTDRAWIEAHGTDSVDIANNSYNDLPKDCQQENYDAAEIIVNVIDAMDETDKSRDNLAGFAQDQKSGNYNVIGNKIHSAWLSRNEWAKGGELDVPFENLPQNEKDEDIAQYLLGIDALYPEDPNYLAEFGVAESSTKAENKEQAEAYDPYSEAAAGKKPGRFYRHEVHPAERVNEWAFDPKAVLDYVGDSPEKFAELSRGEQKQLLVSLRSTVSQSRKETVFRNFQDKRFLSPNVDAAWDRYNQSRADLAKAKVLKRQTR